MTRIWQPGDLSPLVSAACDAESGGRQEDGLEPAMQQVVDAAKTLFKADGAGLMLIGEGECCAG